jgi:gas vesicle protein
MEDHSLGDQGENGFLPGLVIGGIVGAFLTLMVIGEKDEEQRIAIKKRAVEALKNLPSLISDLEGKTEGLARHVIDSVQEGMIVNTEEEKGEPSHIRDIQERGRTAARRFFHRTAKKV